MKYLKNIFFGWDNFHTNLCIFSLLGIMSITFSNIFDLFTGSLYFGYPPVNYIELWINVFVYIFIAIFFKGYIFKYANSLLQNESTKLPDIGISSIVTFFKMFPMFVTWIFYIVILIILGMKMFNMLNFWSYSYYIILGCLIPFIFILFVAYSKNFDFETTIFNPIPLFKIISKCFKPVFVLLLKTVPIIALIFFFITKGFYKTDYLANYPSIQISVRLLLLCFAVYVEEIILLIYTQAFVKIIKDKNIIE